MVFCEEKEEDVSVQEWRGISIESGQYREIRKFCEKGENSLTGEFSKARNNILFLQYTALTKISEWIMLIQHEKKSGRKEGKILMLLTKFEILQSVHRLSTWHAELVCSQPAS